MATKLDQIAKVFNDWIAHKRAIERKMCKEINIKYQDPFADTTVTIMDDHVVVAYDGAGYDYLSTYSTVYNPISNQQVYMGDTNQEKLNKRLHAIDPFLGIENINSWSLGVWL
jgi:hypothetical protein